MASDHQQALQWELLMVMKVVMFSPVSMKICCPKASAGMTEAKKMYVAGANSLHLHHQHMNHNL